MDSGPAAPPPSVRRRRSLTIAYRLLRAAPTSTPSLIPLRRFPSVLRPSSFPRRFRVKTGSFRGRFGVIWGSFWGRFGVVSGSFGGRFWVGLGSVYYHVIVMTETSTPGPATAYRPPHPTRRKKHAFGPRNTISSHDHPPRLSAKVFDEQRCASGARGERGDRRMPARSDRHEPPGGGVSPGERIVSAAAGVAAAARYTRGSDRGGRVISGPPARGPRRRRSPEPAPRRDATSAGRNRACEADRHSDPPGSPCASRSTGAASLLPSEGCC